MKTWMAVFVATLMFTACGQNDNFLATAERNVAARLKDPDSARFTQKTFVVRQAPDERGMSSVAACGAVDGKNSFGAYSGGGRFVVRGLQGPNLLDVSIVELENRSERWATVDSRDGEKPTTVFEKIYWNVYCVDSNHPPTYTGLNE